MFHKKQSQHFVEICEKLGYQFNRKKFLLEALTRRTALMEGKQLDHIGDYQRLEFLGDKIINLAVSDILFEYHPNWSEGQLTRATSSFVNNKGPLADIAESLGLSAYLILGADEERRRVNENTKVLSDAVEALFGAVFLDSGRDYALIRRLVKQHWQPLGLESGEEADTKVAKKPLKYEPEDDVDKALIDAFYSNDDDAVLSLLEKGANPNLMYQTADDYGETISLPYGISLLMLAIRNRDRKLAVALLEKGANPNWQGTYEMVDFNPFPRCSGTLTEIIRHTSDVRRIETQYSALHWLIVDDNHRLTTDEMLDFAKLLLEYGADPSLVDCRGRTPIMCLRSSRESYDDSDRRFIKLLNESFKENAPTPTPKQQAAMLSSAISQTLLDTLSSAMPERSEDDIEDLAAAFMSL